MVERNEQWAEAAVTECAMGEIYAGKLANNPKRAVECFERAASFTERTARYSYYTSIEGRLK